MQKSSPSSRLQSLDALRGFDMFWIISGEGLIHEWAKASDNTAINWMSSQLHHSDWNGFNFYDLIFPLFIFIAGVSMPYSIGKQLANQYTKSQILKSLLKRAVILIILGTIVNGLFKWQGYENTRIASVLGRIALSCLFAGIIFIYTDLRTQLFIFFGILISYFLLLKYVPVPDFGTGVLTKEGNLSAYLDRLFLPGKLHRKVYDPEGLLSTLPAIGNALLGVFTGQFLQLTNTSKFKKVLLMSASGIICILLAWLWSPFFPINKIMWTSSFVLCSGGFSLLFMAFFYLVIDVLSIKFWTAPFIWIGMNSITIYIAAHGLINFEATANYLFAGLIQQLNTLWQPVALAAGIVLVQLGFLHFLYRQKWFLKV